MAYNYQDDSDQTGPTKPTRLRSPASGNVPNLGALPPSYGSGNQPSQSGPIESSLRGIASLPANFSDVRSGLQQNNLANVAGTWQPAATDPTGGRGINSLMARGIGQAVNGTPTFSDGSTFSRLPRTVAGDRLQSLADTNVASSEGYRNPGIGTLGTPVSQNQGVAAAGFNRGIAYYDPSAGYSRASPGSYDPTSSASDYASDLASIASRDPRSVLGRAAWNASAEDTWRRNTGQRPQGIADLTSAAGAMFNARNRSGDENARDQTMFADQVNKGIASMAGIDTKGQYGLDAAQIRADATQNRPNFQVGADGTLYRLSNASATPVTGEDGKPFTAQGKINAGESRLYDDAYSRTLRQELGRGTDQPTAAQRAATAGRSALDAMRNAKYGTSSTPQSASIPQAAIDHLRRNPNLADQFDQKYGGGASVQYLKQQ